MYITNKSEEEKEERFLKDMLDLLKKYGYGDDKTEPMARYKQPNKKYK